jgi:glycosyltransferase involved in cell wall biosynthesis
VNYPLFSRAQLPSTQVPQDLRVVRGPIVGCVTTQTPFMDLELLRQIFGRRPEWSFVFIGVDREEARRSDDRLSIVQDLPNVHFIGRRRHDEMPGYLKGCDVCVIPWMLNDVTLVSSSPLKLYEYLAAGKPIVCKPVPLMQHLDKVVRFAADAGEWIDAIESALQSTDIRDIEARQAVARENTWERRVDFISRELAAR